jgi:hypothetical protein
MNFEDLDSHEDIYKATRKIKQTENIVTVLYRGWMLSPEKYSLLYANLLDKNIRLINNPTEYKNCHYLPDSLPFIKGHTPTTLFEKLNSNHDLSACIAKSSIFANQPVIIKDYVKSEKHDWETACYVENASNTEKLIDTIRNFIALRGKFLNEGIVIREFIELNPLTVHSKSGMPLTEEYRLFFFNRKLLGIYNYWEEGTYEFTQPNTTIFEEIAKKVESNFFSMDIARQKNGELIIIELGDGQVAGLPDTLDKSDFFSQIKAGMVSLVQ